MSAPQLVSVSVSSCSGCAVLPLLLLLPSRIKRLLPSVLLGFQMVPVVKKKKKKKTLSSAGDMGSALGLERSSGGRNGNPLPYSCLENPMGRGAWWTTVHGVTESDTTEEI